MHNTSTNKPRQFRGSLDLIDTGGGFCEIDAVIPIEIGRAIAALLKARIIVRDEYTSV